MIAEDFDFEPVRGLPGHLPPGETLLWQGSPSWRAVARTVYRLPMVAGYFGVLIAFGTLSALLEGQSIRSAVQPALWLAPLGMLSIGILTLMAWLTERTTIYSLTSRRVIMRFGLALPITLNLPFSQIGGAALKIHRDGSGDIPLDLASKDHLAYLVLWPHARPWRFSRPQPMLRCIPDADKAAQILAEAMTLAFPASAANARRVTDVAPQPAAQHSAAAGKERRPSMAAAS
ncbi:photosynthetic complex putative assembly protein PuhB [Methylocapsa palsarum]|uniref:PH domain-containing protein n=1 Tax=Methylocapsa palsarum TaxID=1612308 RepID=A0A1I4BEP2_9HYPH|nr:photosynthetic complex putative assembly protein PuhB [Methylocapsa palsarum]SFK66471.1 PH domain-containing protein [Methylocapsa palsarum]